MIWWCSLDITKEPCNTRWRTYKCQFYISAVKEAFFRFKEIKFQFLIQCKLSLCALKFIFMLYLFLLQKVHFILKRTNLITWVDPMCINRIIVNDLLGLMMEILLLRISKSYSSHLRNTFWLWCEKKEKTIILSLILVFSGSIFTVISKNNTNYWYLFIPGSFAKLIQIINFLIYLLWLVVKWSNTFNQVYLFSFWFSFVLDHIMMWLVLLTISVSQTLRNNYDNYFNSSVLSIWKLQ